MAREEIASPVAEAEELEEKMTLALLPTDPLDEKNIMPDALARAGTAGIWAGDLWRMYRGTRRTWGGRRRCLLGPADAAAQGSSSSSSATACTRS